MYSHATSCLTSRPHPRFGLAAVNPLLGTVSALTEANGHVLAAFIPDGMALPYSSASLLVVSGLGSCAGSLCAEAFGFMRPMACEACEHGCAPCQLDPHQQGHPMSSHLPWLMPLNAGAHAAKARGKPSGQRGRPRCVHI